MNQNRYEFVECVGCCLILTLVTIYPTYLKDHVCTPFSEDLRQLSALDICLAPFRKKPLARSAESLNSTRMEQKGMEIERF